MLDKNGGKSYRQQSGIHPDTLDAYRNLNAKRAAKKPPKPPTGKPKPTGSGRGGSGGSGGSKGVKGIEYYHNSKFNPKGYRTAAQLQTDAAIEEKLRASNVARGQASADYQNAIRELQQVRDSNSLNATKQGAEDTGRLNNMSLNRDMGYGAGAGTNMTSLMNKYADIQSGIASQYANDYSKQTYDYGRQMNDYNEADRVIRNSRAAEIDALYRQLYGEAWDRYIAKNNLGMSAIQQRNQARAAAQGR